MKIFFDYKIFLHQKLGGISRYIVNLHKQLLKKDIVSKIYAPIHINIFLKEINDSDNFYIKKKIILSTKIIRFYNSIKTNFFLKKFNPDIIHLSYYKSALLNSKKPIVVTVYDLIHEIYYKTAGNFKKEVLNRADHIICISKSTLDDLISIYNIDIKKASVIHLGVNYLNSNYKESLSKAIVPYILYVGDRQKYKNFRALTKLYALSKSINNNYKIICFGGGDFTFEEKKYFKEKNINFNNIIYVSGDDKKLAELYKSATALIITSLYEGFGMTAIEAQYFGCPVISNKAKALFEILQNSAIYFDVNNIDDMKSIFERYLFSKADLDLLRIKGYENIKKYTLEKNAEETIKIYKKLL